VALGSGEERAREVGLSAQGRRDGGCKGDARESEEEEDEVSVGKNG